MELQEFYKNLHAGIKGRLVVKFTKKAAGSWQI